MNARDRRLARRKAERLALEKGSGSTAVAERDVAPDEALEAVDLPEDTLAEVGPVLSPERAALALVTSALDLDEPDTHTAEVTIEIVPPETVALRLVPSAVEELVAGLLVNGEPVAADSPIASTLRVSLENFVFDPDGYIVADAMEVDLPAEMQPGETVPARTPSPAPPDAPMVRDPADGLRWTASFAPEGFLTDDGRAIAPGALSWREPPLTLMAMVETTDSGHDGALVSGRIDQIWRGEDSMVRGSGVFDEGEFGLEIARMVDDRTLRGISIDMAIQAAEVGPRSDYFTDDGEWAPRTETDEPDAEPSLFDMLFGEEVEEPILVITDAVIGAVTVCPFPAFANTTIEMAASIVAAGHPAAGMVLTVTQQGGFTIVPERSAETVEEAHDDPEAVTASAAGLVPVRPPADWFLNPQLEELMPLTVDEDGRIVGHAWAWDTCHIGIPGVCTTAPHSRTDYALFHLKEVECDDGSRVACGTITLEAPHADKRLNRADATAHYDNTGTAVADVICGEDEHGGWVSGALRPSVDAEKARMLRGAVLSGDWRNVDGNLELVALLAVNVPGFPVPRVRALVAAGEDGGEPEVLALVAAGIHLNEGLLSAEDRERMLTLRDQADGTFAELAARAKG